MKVIFAANGNKVQVDTDVSMTVGELKNQIQERLGVPATYQRIYCKGAELHNMNARLGEYASEDEALELSAHLNGGCSEGCNCCGLGESCSCTIL